MFCNICKKDIEKKYAGNHKRWCGKTTSKEFNCKSCNKIFVAKRKRKYCSRACLNKGLYTPEFKEKISNGRKNYLKNNLEKHVWKRSKKFTSKPCEDFKDKLKKSKINFVEEFQPLENRFYSIDVAFPEIKLGIEINGEQHYNRDKSLKKYYQDRHDLIEKSGWLLIELHYSLVYNDKKVNKIINSLNDKFKLKEINVDFELRKNKKQKRIDEEKNRKLKEKAEKDTILQNRLSIIKNYEKSYGWISRISKELCISHTHVRRLIKKYLPDEKF